MALQSSGEITLDQIRTELGSTSGDLRVLSQAAGFSTPDQFSDFYGFSAATAYTFLMGDGGNGYGDYSGACAEAYDPITLYSSSTSLATNVTLYTDNTLSTPFSGNGWYKSGSTAYEIGSEGRISAVRGC
jgi:hypothetical protein